MYTDRSLDTTFMHNISRFDHKHPTTFYTVVSIAFKDK